MSLILDVLYFVGGLAGAPLIIAKSLRTGKYRSGWSGRFGFGPAILPRRSPQTSMLLLHCVSVGELLSVQTLITKLLAADENLHLTIATGTDTGTARAHALYPANPNDPKHNPRVHLVRYPLDFSFAIESVLDRVRPDAIALAELELWPNFLEIAESRRIPVAIINGRISDRSFPRYRFIRPIMAGMLRRIAWIGAQTPRIARRFELLGAQHVETIPTLKYDNAPTSDKVAGADALAAAVGFAPSGMNPPLKLFVAGSTGAGEEGAILDAYIALREKFPELRLAIVPRHPEVVPQVLAAITRRNLSPIKRTERPDQLESRNSNLETHEVFVLDTMGELRKLYSVAFAVFVGRSLVKLGGSDMIEVAAMGKPCCFGPYTQNFAEVVELLLAENTAAVVRDATELTALLDRWLTNPANALALGARAKAVIDAQRGSTDRYVANLLQLVHGNVSRRP